MIRLLQEKGRVLKGYPMKKIFVLIFYMLIGFKGELLLPQWDLYKKIPESGFVHPQVWGKNTKYSFALLNRNTTPIWISLKNGDIALIPLYRVLPSGKDSLKGVMAEVDITLPTVLTIKSQDKSGSQKSYSFAIGKTIYVTWTKEGALRPQIGKVYGLFPQGRSGFELNRNVQPGDIKKF